MTKWLLLLLYLGALPNWIFLLFGFTVGLFNGWWLLLCLFSSLHVFVLLHRNPHLYLFFRLSWVDEYSCNSDGDMRFYALRWKAMTWWFLFFWVCLTGFSSLGSQLVFLWLVDSASSALFILLWLRNYCWNGSGLCQVRFVLIVNLVSTGTQVFLGGLRTSLVNFSLISFASVMQNWLLNDGDGLVIRWNW